MQKTLKTPLHKTTLIVQTLLENLEEGDKLLNQTIQRAETEQYGTEQYGTEQYETGISEKENNRTENRADQTVETIYRLVKEVYQETHLESILTKTQDTHSELLKALQLMKDVLYMSIQPQTPDWKTMEKQNAEKLLKTIRNQCHNTDKPYKKWPYEYLTDHWEKRTAGLKETAQTLEKLCIKQMGRNTQQKHYLLVEALSSSKNRTERNLPNLVAYRKRTLKQTVKENQEDLTLQNITAGYNHAGIGLLPEQHMETWKYLTEPLNPNILDTDTNLLQTAVEIYAKTELSFLQSLETAKHI